MSEGFRSEQARADSVRVDKLIGAVLANRYQIESRLGEGAMGSVYRARHIKVGRPFAVKILHPRLLEDPKQLQRFEREAELAGRLHHPNVIGVVDVGETVDGLRYMVMDFAEGHDLATLLSEAPMPPERIHKIVRQMLEGLYHAHEAGLIHRDFKPENVIIEKDAHGEEVPRIVDFGIAILREGGDPSDGTGRLTTNGLVLGTPHYMAPEQAVNDPIDHRIDLFALGIIIYEMLSGKLPFDGHGAEVARANLLLDPPPISERVPYLEVDPLLEAFARRLMLKKREQRPATAKIALNLLDLIAKDRVAAAAEFGVPAEAAARTGRSTEPVQPRHVSDGDFAGTFPPPMSGRAPTMNNAVAVRVKTPPSGVEIAPASKPFDSMTAMVTPRSKQKYWIAGVLGLLLIGGVVVVATHGASEQPAKKIDPPIVAIEQPKPKVETPPVVVAPPPVVDQTPPVVVETAKTSPKKPVGKLQTNQPPVVVKQPEVVTQTQVKQPELVKQPEVAKPYDATAFLVQYQAVGAELKVYTIANGVNVASAIQAKYNDVSYMSANASQASRDEARKKLDAIHALINKK